jgi:hypothetical protein
MQIKQGPASSVGVRGRRSEARNGGEPAVGSSVKPSQAANDNLTGRTRQVWQPRLGRDLSREDARQIAENVTGFFTILAEWSRVETPSPANDTGKPTASQNGPERRVRDWYTMARYCRSRRHRITKRELEVLNNIIARGTLLSEKQFAWLVAIDERVRHVEERL